MEVHQNTSSGGGSGCLWLIVFALLWWWLRDWSKGIEDRVEALERKAYEMRVDDDALRERIDRLNERLGAK